MGRQLQPDGRAPQGGAATPADTVAKLEPAAKLETVTKLMSLTEAEFRAGLAALLGQPAPGVRPWSGEVPARVAVGEGHVTLSYTALKPVRLGGLLELPQALVSLAFEGVAASDRAAFERRFWIAFQRGGG